MLLQVLQSTEDVPAGSLELPEQDKLTSWAGKNGGLRVILSHYDKN